MKPYTLILTTLIALPLWADLSTDMEKNMYAPAREMMQMDAAMNKAMEQHNPKERLIEIIDETGAGLVDEPLVEMQDKGDHYLIEKSIPESNTTNVKVSIKEEMVEILVTENKTFRIDNMEQNMSSTSSEMHSIPEDANPESLKSIYKDGALTVTFDKK